MTPNDLKNACWKVVLAKANWECARAQRDHVIVALAAMGHTPHQLQRIYPLTRSRYRQIIHDHKQAASAAARTATEAQSKAATPETSSGDRSTTSNEHHHTKGPRQ
jgi:aspartokinase